MRSRRLQLVSPLARFAAGVAEGDLVEFLPARRRVVAGDAGLAELVAVEANRSRDRLDRQREQLLEEFDALESTIANMKSNLTALNSLQIVPPLTSSK